MPTSDPDPRRNEGIKARLVLVKAVENPHKRRAFCGLDANKAHFIGKTA
jgi:hypothetical protein